jgi:hypothetical protein
MPMPFEFQNFKTSEEVFQAMDLALRQCPYCDQCHNSEMVTINCCYTGHTFTCMDFKVYCM